MVINHKINVLVNEYKDGMERGYDISRCKYVSDCGWVKRMLNTESNGCWKTVYNHILNRNGGTFVCECNLNTRHIKVFVKTTISSFS